MNLVAKIYLFEITDAYSCFRKTSATNVLCLGKIKKNRGRGEIQKTYFKNTALKIRIWTFVLLKCITGDPKE